MNRVNIFSNLRRRRRDEQGLRISFPGVQTVLDDAGATENLLRQLRHLRKKYSLIQMPYSML